MLLHLNKVLCEIRRPPRGQQAARDPQQCFDSGGKGFWDCRYKQWLTIPGLGATAVIALPGMLEVGMQELVSFDCWIVGPGTYALPSPGNSLEIPAPPRIYHHILPQNLQCTLH